MTTAATTTTVPAPASTAATVATTMTTPVAATTTTASTAPSVTQRQPVPANWLAVWDVCTPDSDVRIIDDTTGAPQTTLPVQGRPVWSHDRTRIAAVDDLSGAFRVADVTTGATTVVTDPGWPSYRGDDCGTLADVVGWSPDDTAVLIVSHNPASGSVTVVRVDGSSTTTIWSDVGPARTVVAARWQADGQVTIVTVGAEAGDLTVQHGDPWHDFPATTAVIPRPTPDTIETMTISPDATMTAMWRLSLSNGVRTPDSTTAVLVVDNASGAARTLSEREPATELVFSPDSRQVAFGEYPPGRDLPPLVVAPADGGGDHTFPIPGDFTEHVAWSADETAVLTGGRSVQRVDPVSGATTTLIPLDPPPDPTNTDPNSPPTGNEEYAIASNAG